MVEGNLQRNIFAVDEMHISPYHVTHQDFTLPMVQTSWFLLGLTLLLAVTWRKRVYVLFQYSHKFVGIVFFIIAIIHAWSFW